MNVKLLKDFAIMAGRSDLQNTQIFLLSVFRKSDKYVNTRSQGTRTYRGKIAQCLLVVKELNKSGDN